MSKKYRLGFIPLCLALVLPFIVRLAYIHVPLERDEGAYAYGAWRIMEGDVLYKDMVDFTPPGVFYLYALGMSICGTRIDDIRLFTCLYMEIVLVWMLLLARRLCNNRSAWIATAIFGFISVEPSVLGFTSNKEIFLLLPIVAASHMLLKGLAESKNRFVFISGILLGAGFFIKQVIVFLGAGYVGYMLVDAYKKELGWKASLARITVPAGMLIAGAVTAGALVSLHFFLQDAFTDFYYWVFTYTIKFTDVSLDMMQIVKHLSGIMGTILVGDAFFWGASAWAMYMLIKVRSLHGWFLVFLAVSLIAAVTAGFRFRQHYFILLTPVIALAAGWGISHMVDLIKAVQQRTLRMVLAGGLVVCAVGLPVISNWNYAFSSSPEQISRKLYGTNPFVESPRIAAYVKEHTPEDETIFVFGSEPQIYFYAGKKNPTNQLFIYPLTASYGKAGAFQREVVSAVKSARPYYIIWIDIQTSLYASEPAQDRYVFDELEKIIQEEYVLDGYVLIGKESSVYRFGERTVDPLYADEKIPIFLYKRKIKQI